VPTDCHRHWINGTIGEAHEDHRLRSNKFLERFSRLAWELDRRALGRSPIEGYTRSELVGVEWHECPCLEPGETHPGRAIDCPRVEYVLTGKEPPGDRPVFMHPRLVWRVKSGLRKYKWNSLASALAGKFPQVQDL
jgi:hypothetical protein